MDSPASRSQQKRSLNQSNPADPQLRGQHAHQVHASNSSAFGSAEQQLSHDTLATSIRRQP